VTFKIALFAVFLCTSVAHAGDAEARAAYGARPGYLFNVNEEKNSRDIEMVMLDRPKDPPKPTTPPLVDEKLSKEFQQQYQYRFGQTAQEQIINSPMRDDEYTYQGTQNVTMQDYHHYQQQFGEYMARRLTEYHVDRFAKNDPSIRPMYELKDKISNVNMKVGKAYKIKWKYSFSGPFMEASLDNPYDIECKVQAQMSGIVSAPAEMIYSVAYPLTKRVRAGFVYRQMDGLYQAVVSRQISSHLSTSVTGSVDTRAEGPIVQQNLFLVGLSWNE
jgi:hypothetical protein